MKYPKYTEMPVERYGKLLILSVRAKRRSYLIMLQSCLLNTNKYFRNLSYGRQNDENKRAIKNAGGITALVR